MTTANYRDSNGNWKSWTPDMVGVAANANTLGGGTHIPKAAYGVVDYNNTGQTITLGYAGAGFTSSDFTYALGLNTSRQIKDVSKDEYRKWLGLGSAAYTASNAYAAASHSHTSLTDIDASSRQISISYAGDAATSMNHLCCFVNNGTKIKDANEAAVKTLLGLNNVNNTADSNKSVKYATSSGSADYASKANILKYTHTNEVNFSGGKQNTCYFNYRNADTDTCDGGTTGITYKFCNYNNNVANTTLDAASFTGNAGGTDYYRGVKGKTWYSSSSNDSTLCYINLPSGYWWLLTAELAFTSAGTNGCCLSIYDNNAVGNSYTTITQAYAGYASLHHSSIVSTASASNKFYLLGRIGGSGGGYMGGNICAVRIYKP